VDIHDACAVTDDAERLAVFLCACATAIAPEAVLTLEAASTTLHSIKRLTEAGLQLTAESPPAESHLRCPHTTCAALRQLCTRHGLDDRGRKVTLVARLCNHFGYECVCLMCV
jgi:hypothetical protein